MNQTQPLTTVIQIRSKSPHKIDSYRALRTKSKERSNPYADDPYRLTRAEKGPSSATYALTARDHSRCESRYCLICSNRR